MVSKSCLMVTNSRGYRFFKKLRNPGLICLAVLQTKETKAQRMWKVH